MDFARELLQHQNPDGGWGYGHGGSWTEPSCYALLALAADNRSASDPVRRAVHWLAKRQRADGGWPPRDAVSQSTWVTALVLLLPVSLRTGIQTERGTSWLMSQTGRETNFIFWLRQYLLGAHPGKPGFDGWPWYPGTAAWVAPTALSVLALEKANCNKRDPAVEKRIEEGRKFLLDRRCPDGGWNHGATKALGYESPSYPETTGMALLALHGSSAPEMALAEREAERQLSSCRSPDAAAWLRLGLLARGRQVPAPDLPVQAGPMELSLRILARAAEQGRNLFLEST